MAKVDIKMPDVFLEKLSGLGARFDAIAPKVLEAGVEPLLNKAKANLAGAIGRNTKNKSKSTGALLASIGVTPARQDQNGDWDIKVGIGKSKDSTGVSNALKGMVLEYGKHGQPPKPWLKPAKLASKSACIQAMKDKLGKELV